MLGGARFGRLGAWGLSALLKGPRGPGRLGGGGAPRGAGRWPEDILLEAVGLGGGDLEQVEGGTCCTAGHRITSRSFYIYAMLIFFLSSIIP